MSAPARYATPRDPARDTDGARVAGVARALGVPLMPWQRQVVDTATERDADGNLVYEIVMVTVPRQSGKSTLVWALFADRLLTTRRASMFYTAQTQQDARQRVADFEKLAADSPFADLLKFRRSMSDTGASCTVTGSRLGTFAPSVTAMHGETPPLVVLDEIFAHSQELGDAMLEDAILPAQITLGGRRQVWLISTAGTAESTFMRKWRDIGRAGSRPRMAYFEWSMPDGADPFDPATIEGFHPAVGYTTTVADVLAARGARLAAWLRAYCNVWTETADPLVPLDTWDALPRNTAPPSTRDVAVSIEAALDSSAASVMAAWTDTDGTPHVHTVHTAPGTAWIEQYVAQLADEWQPRSIAADNGGTTRRLADDLERRGLDIRRLTGVEFSTATDSLLAAIRDGTLHHDGSETLRRGIAGAVLHRTGDTARISRTGSTGYVAGLIGAAVALRAATHAPTIAPKPLVTF